MITWLINELCNFRCDYCWEPHDRKVRQEIDIVSLSESLIYLKKDWLFYITGGGEPFLEKNIVEICQEITKKHYLAVYTNLSTANVFDFANTINPGRCLYIYAAVHIAEREKKDPGLVHYTEKMLYLQKKGFNVISYYLAYPPLFGRIKPDIAFLKSNGIEKVRIKIFNGFYEGKYYPFSFNTEQKDFLKNMEGDYPEFDILDKSNIYYGQLCRTGQKTLVMDRDGNLSRCHSSLKKYGNLFEKTIRLDTKPKPCPKMICECAPEGIKNTLPSKGNCITVLKENIIEQSMIFKKEGIANWFKELIGTKERKGVPMDAIKKIKKT